VHILTVGWHRAMLSYSGPGDGEEPSAETAAAYWAHYDPAMYVPFRTPLVPWADVLATAQACADEVGLPLQATSGCGTHWGRLAEGGEPRFRIPFSTVGDGTGTYATIEVDLVTGESTGCEHLHNSGE
jgi:hypothetical protein